MIIEHLHEHLRGRAAGGPTFFAHRTSIKMDPKQARQYAGTFVQRDYFEITMFVGGDGQVPVLDRDGDTRLDPHRPGCLYLYRPQDRRCLRGTDFTPEPMTFFRVGFPPDEWRTFTRLIGIDVARLTAKGAVMNVVDPDENGMRESFERVLHAASHTPTMLDLMRFWIEVTPRLLPSSMETTSAVTPLWLHRSIEAMHDDMNLREGLSRFLELAHVSARQLSRATNLYLGTTPREIVMDLRIRRAAHLLRTTLDSVASIADRCGFASPAHFSTCFRNVMDVSPRDFRQGALGGSSR